MPAPERADVPAGVVRRERVLFLPQDRNPYQGLLAAALAAEGFDVVMGPNPRREPLPILRAWLLQGRPRLVHLHWTHRYLGRAGSELTRLTRWRFLGQLWLLQRAGVRLVWTAHNLGSHEGQRSVAEREVHRALVARAAAVISHCQVAQDLLVRAYGLDAAAQTRLRVVPHGSYVGAYPAGPGRGAARASLGLPAEGRVFLFLGQIRGYKGVDDLIAAFRSVGEPAARLVIAGRAVTEALEVSIREAATPDPRIALRLGFVPDAEMGVLLDAADAVVLPFRDILTSGSAILAMSFGRPIVAPRIGCLPELVDADAAILYPPGADGALADALRAALAADLDALGRHARELADGLDWAAIAATTARLYRG